MSNSDIEGVDVVAQTQAGETTPGIVLRQARESRGLSLEEVAAQLNLRVSILEQLESDSYENLPGATFARGYIRSYGNLLGLDGESLAKSCVLGNTRENVRPLQNIERKSRSRFFLISFVLLLIVIAALASFWWVEQKNQEQQSLAEAPPVVEQVAIEGVDGRLHIQSLDELQAHTANMAIEEVVLPASEPMPETADSSAMAGQQQDGAAVEEDTGVLDILELSFIEDCWIRITDMHGNEVASGLQRAGDELRLEGNGPFELHLGYARGVFISLNGQQVDFDSKIQGNVARIKLG